MLVVGQALSRSVRSEVDDAAALEALGTTRSGRVLATLPRTACTAAVAALVSATVALGSSHLFPLEPVRAAEPDPGLRADWLVLALTPVLVVLGTLVLGALSAWRATGPPRLAPGERTVLGGAPARWGLPAALVAGAELARRPARSATGVPGSVVAAGTAAAVAIVVGASGFGASLDRLTDSPALYGWTWDAMVFDPPEAGDDVAGRIVDDPALDAVTAVRTRSVTVGDRSVLTLGIEPLRGDILPVVTDGRAPADDDEAALGGKTLRRLDVDVGDTVAVSARGGTTRRLEVVGRVLFPVVNPDVSSSVDVGEGMVLTAGGLEAVAGSVRPMSYLVDLAPGQGFAALAASYGQAFGPQQPPDVRNIERVGAIPSALAAVVAALGAGMLAFGLAATVRRRRRDLAVLRTLGFDRRQVRWTVASQATTLVAPALLVGVPLGLVLGRQGWRAVARGLSVPAEPAASAVVVAATIVGTLVLANAAAALAAVRAGRARPGDLLRTE
jgi:hypothetical protein